ncbi:hypothetical protein MBLNU230_g0091t1 [Neophaeotheca triangularis]
MAPVRKKSKPNTDPDTPNGQASRDQSGQDVQKESTTKTHPTDAKSAEEPQDPHTDVTASKPPQSNRSSWYSTASWRSKASPVAQVARESISVAQGATSEALAESGRQISEASSRPGQYMSKSMRGSRKSIPLAAEATRVHATSDAGDQSRPRQNSAKSFRGMDGGNESKEAQEEPKLVSETAPLPPEPPVQPTIEEESKSDAGSVEQPSKPQQPTSWFGWWSRPDGYDAGNEKGRQNATKQEATETPLPSDGEEAQSSVEPGQDLPAGVGHGPEMITDTAAEQGAKLQPEASVNQSYTRSWFGLWSNAQYDQSKREDTAKEPEPSPKAAPVAPEVTVSAEPETAAQDKNDSDTSTQNTNRPDSNEERPRSSGWAFWSTDRPKEAAPTPGGTQKQVGELAVADTPSQSHPEAAQFNEQREDQSSAQSTAKRTASLLRPKRGRTDQETGKASPGASSAVTPASSRVVTPAETPSATPPREASEAPKPVPRGKQPQTKPNLILPAFHDVYRPALNPGYLERIGSYVAQSLRIPGSQIQPPPLHASIAPSPHKVRRAIALGIHGFFPMPLIQKVLGQPTGTSIRFANYAATSIKTWADERQPEVKDLEIEKVALEGEGYIADRVSTLWKLLLNWLSHLRQADFILVACHSQGVPVSCMLVAKLIQLGCLSPNVRVGICAMAGINLGPFPEYKSRLFGGSALELFDFGDSSSKVSKAYTESLELCLRHGVRVTFVGSLDDQLVSLESSLYTPLSHPYVSRATFIDGRLHTPNFLTHLVVFALKLRNRGISDHGLVRELSGPLAGSLVGGEGHSRVYDDPAVYRWAIDFALESTDVVAPPAPPAPTPASNVQSTAAQKKQAFDDAAAKRSSLGGPPSTLAAANSIRRGSVATSTTLPGIAPVIQVYTPPPTSSNANPFYLPWAVRGMLEEAAVKQDFQDEVKELVEEFEAWKPTSKVLKDVRWRLEGVRSML